MESNDLPEGVERVEQVDEHTYRVYDTDGSVHTVRYEPRRQPRRPPQTPGRE